MPGCKDGDHRLFVSISTLRAGRTHVLLEAVAVGAFILLGEHVRVVEVRPPRSGLAGAETQVRPFGIAEIHNGRLVPGIAFGAGHVRGGLYDRIVVAEGRGNRWRWQTGLSGAWGMGAVLIRG